MQNSYGQKKRTSPSCKYQWLLMLQMKGKLWKCCDTQVFWKITDGPMCKSPRVAIGAGTQFLDTLRYQDKTYWPCWPILFSKRNKSKVYKFHYFSKITMYFTIFLRITMYYEPCLTGDYSHVGGLNHLNQPSLSWTVPLFWDSCPNPKHPSSDIAVRSVNFTTQVRYTPRINDRCARKMVVNHGKPGFCRDPIFR
jgi:hypothetical protein